MAPMEQFPGNTNRDKEKKKPQEAPKSVEKVVVGEVVQRKKPLGRRFKDVFLGGEFKSASHYILTEVLLPAFRNMLVDATTKGVERVVYGETTMRRPSQASGRSRVSYNNPVDRYPSRRANLPDQPASGRKRQDSSDLILASREEAELVLERLNDIIDQFDVASVADLHELVGLPTTFVDNKWGWFNLHYASVRQIREGYLLELPPAEPL